MGPLRRSLLEKELESVGIRLNKHKPNIYFKVRPLSPADCSARGSGLGQPVAEAHGAAGPSSTGLPSPLLLQPKKGGGISFNSTVTLTQCSEKLVQLILHEYSILNKWIARGIQSLQSTGGAPETALLPQEQQASQSLEQAVRELRQQCGTRGSRPPCLCALRVEAYHITPWLVLSSGFLAPCQLQDAMVSGHIWKEDKMARETAPGAQGLLV